MTYSIYERRSPKKFPDGAQRQKHLNNDQNPVQRTGQRCEIRGNSNQCVRLTISGAMPNLRVVHRRFHLGNGQLLRMMI